MYFRHSDKLRKGKEALMRLFNLQFLAMLLISTMPKIVAAQCEFLSLDSLNTTRFYFNSLESESGVNDINTSRVPPGAPTYNVQSLQVPCPTSIDPSITFTFNFGTTTLANPNSILTGSVRLVGFIYLDIDPRRRDHTGLPLGHLNNYIASPDVVPPIQGGKYIARLGADYCIDLTAIPTTDASGAFLYPVLKLNHNPLMHTNCHGAAVLALNSSGNEIKAKVNVNLSGGALNLVIKIEDIVALDSRTQGVVDFTGVLGYSTSFVDLGVTLDPTNPATYHPTEIVPDEPNTDGRVGRNCDVGFIDVSGGGSPFGKKAITLASRAANQINERENDRFVFLNLINGIPYSYYSVDLISTPNLFAAIDTSRRAVTERAFGFRLDLKLKRGDTLNVLLTPEVSESASEIERGSGPVGILFFDPAALDKFLNSIGDRKINIQGFNDSVATRDTKPPGFFSGWSPFNKVDAGDLKGKNSLQSLDDIRVIPNPLKIGAPDRIVFVNLPPSITIRIYTERGDLIKTIEHTDGSNDEEWDLTTASGKVCATGVYIAHFQPAQGESTFRKFLIMRKICHN